MFFRKLVCLGSLLFVLGQILSGETLRLATYNLRNYLIMDRMTEAGWRPEYPKPEAEKAAIRQVILEADADILLLQELGPEPFLKELQADLALEGLNYTYAYLGEGNDPVRHLAVLSKRRPVAVTLHSDLDFKYFDGRELVKRGLLELSFEDANGEVFKVFGVHLKSRWSEVKADPDSAMRRTREAEACRNRLIERTYDLGQERFLLAGDLNDQPSSSTFRRFEQRGDLSIAERVSAEDSRGEVWTHYYEKVGAYTLVDAIFVSPQMREAVVESSGRIIDSSGALTGSDHRLVLVDLEI